MWTAESISNSDSITNFGAPPITIDLSEGMSLEQETKLLHPWVDAKGRPPQKVPLRCTDRFK